MINNVFSTPNPTPTTFDETYGEDDHDRSEPAVEQLYTDTNEEYNVDTGENSEESERMDQDNYSLDEGSEAEINMDEGENSASGSDVEKPQILNVVKNVKGTRKPSKIIFIDFFFKKVNVCFLVHGCYILCSIPINHFATYSIFTAE